MYKKFHFLKFVPKPPIFSVFIVTLWVNIEDTKKFFYKTNFKGATQSCPSVSIQHRQTVEIFQTNVKDCPLALYEDD